MKRYPIQDVMPDGRRRVGIDSKGQPAQTYEKVTGWAMLEKDRPVHRRKKRR